MLTQCTRTTRLASLPQADSSAAFGTIETWLGAGSGSIWRGARLSNAMAAVIAPSAATTNITQNALRRGPAVANLDGRRVARRGKTRARSQAEPRSLSAPVCKFVRGGLCGLRERLLFV